VATLGRVCQVTSLSFQSSCQNLGVLLEVSPIIIEFVESGLGKTIDISAKQHLDRGGGRGEAWWGLDDLVISGSYTTKAVKVIRKGVRNWIKRKNGGARYGSRYV